MPADETYDPVATFNAVADRYDNVDVEFFTPIGAELVRRAGIAPGDHVLDVGCGRGAVLRPAAAAAGPTGRVTGVDLAPAMVELTAAAMIAEPTVTVRVGDAANPDFPPGTFDLVTAGLVLFLLPDPEAALTAYRRLLRPGGRLAFSCFAAYDPLYRPAIGAMARHADGVVQPPPDHEMFRSEATLRAALAGWADVRISDFRLVSRFRDIDHFVAWVGSHAGRQVVGRIPPERLAAATASAAEVLAGARTPDGGLAITTDARIVVATS
jgi:SAM-dependent methyltransferase